MPSPREAANSTRAANVIKIRAATTPEGVFSQATAPDPAASRLSATEIFLIKRVVLDQHTAIDVERHAAYELAPDGIRVNAVCPGPTATGFGGTMPTEEAKASRALKIPLGRMCEPEDIADPILFLAGDAARMITGVALNVDGGVLVKNDTPYEEYFRRR